MSKRALWTKLLIEQRQWIEECGGDLSGYIAHYGDPGISPLDANGDPKTLTVPVDKAHLFDGVLAPVDEMPGIHTIRYYAGHFGNGGTAIYNADLEALRRIEDRLARCK